MLRRFLSAAVDSLVASNDLGKATRQLGLFIHVMICTCKRANHCDLNPRGHRALELVSASEFQLARNLQFLCSAPDSIKTMNCKELESPDASLRQGEIWMQEKSCLAALGTALGVTPLRVIMPTTRLTFLLMSQAHAEDHRTNPRDFKARARQDCWIPQGRWLTQKVIRDCVTCRRNTLAMGTLMNKICDLESVVIEAHAECLRNSREGRSQEEVHTKVRDLC